MRITNIPIVCADVERKCYIFYGPTSRCIGEFKEQSNDAGEIQYVWDMYWNVLDTMDITDIILPAIDLNRREFPYIRSGGVPYYVECSTVPEYRGDLPKILKDFGMDYYDRFELMLRSRAISNKSNCYLGRTRDDVFDYNTFCKNLFRAMPGIPCYPCGNFENDYHPIEKR